jgi:hypothetical protein
MRKRLRVWSTSQYAHSTDGAKATDPLQLLIQAYCFFCGGGAAKDKGRIG